MYSLLLKIQINVKELLRTYAVTTPKLYAYKKHCGHSVTVHRIIALALRLAGRC